MRKVKLVEFSKVNYIVDCISSIVLYQIWIGQSYFTELTNFQNLV